MTRRLVITPLADADVRRICDRIADDDARAADSLDEQFQERFTLIAAVPGMGRARADVSIPNILFAWMDDYGIAYLASDREVVIVRVFHGKQDVRRVFRRPLT